MAPEDPSGARPGQPVVLRIKLRYGDIDTMVQRFAPNVGKSGLFLPTRTMHPVGTDLKFELRLATDQPVLVGLGRVKEARAPDPNNPRTAFGLAVELMRVTREGRDVILKMLERRRQLGLSDVAIPVPSDVESARRLDVETNPRIALPPTPAASDEPSGPAKLTSPRRSTGPHAAAKVATVEPLAPEPPRKKRVPLGELLDAASGPISAPGVDDDAAVDVGKALARARALAGTDLDKELEVLLDSQAAPIAIDVESASAELARQLGGVAVRKSGRHPSAARWAPPPVVSEPPAITEAPVVAEALQAAAAELAHPVEADAMAAALDAAAAQLARPVPAPAMPEPAMPEPAMPEPAMPEPAIPEPEIVAPEAIATVVEPPPPDEPMLDEPPAQDTLDADADVAAATAHAEAAADAAAADAAADAAAADDDEHDAAAANDDEHEVEPSQIADEIHHLDEEDFEEVEETHDGDNPMHARGRAHTMPPPIPLDLEDRLDEHLARAEDEADEELGIRTRALPVGVYNRPQSDFSATSDGEGGEASEVAERPSSDYLPTLDGESAPNEELDLDRGERDDEIVDDFEILAEADAHAAVDDDDDAPDDSELVDPATLTPPPRHSVSDFALRLDLPDDSEILRLERRRLDSEADPIAQSAGAALAAFDDDDASVDDSPARRRRGPRPLYVEDPPSATYTLAAELPDLDPRLDTRLAQFDESDVIALPPVARKPSRRASPRTSPPPLVRRPTPVPPPQEADLDLESALEALDVDLDDLSIPHAPTELRRDLPKSAAAQLRPAAAKPPRATTEDGILIDFDDDD